VARFIRVLTAISFTAALAVSHSGAERPGAGSASAAGDPSAPPHYNSCTSMAWQGDGKCKGGQ
jgi:hypothetical protein